MESETPSVGAPSAGQTAEPSKGVNAGSGSADAQPGQNDGPAQTSEVDDPSKWAWGTGEAAAIARRRGGGGGDLKPKQLLTPQEKRQLKKAEMKEKRAARATGRAGEFDIKTIYNQLLEAADDDSDNDSSGKFDYIVSPALPKELRKLVWKLGALFYYEATEQGGGQKKPMLLTALYKGGKRRRPDKNQRAAAEVLLEDWRKASAGEKSKEILEGAGQRFADRRKDRGGRGPRPSDYDDAVERGKTTDYLLHTESGITKERERKVDRKKEKAMKGGGRHNKGKGFGDDARTSASALRSFTAFLPSSDGGLKPYSVDADGNLIPQKKAEGEEDNEEAGAKAAAPAGETSDDAANYDDEEDSDDDDEDDSDYDSEDDEEGTDEDEEEEEEEDDSSGAEAEAAIAQLSVNPEKFFVRSAEVVGSEQIEAPVAASAAPDAALAVTVALAGDTTLIAADADTAALPAIPATPATPAGGAGAAQASASPSAAAGASGARGSGSNKKLWSNSSSKGQYAALPSSSIASSPFAEVETKRLFVHSSLRGEWERHTTGIGSKLMAKMGYTGGHLGRAGESPTKGADAGGASLLSPPSPAHGVESSATAAGATGVTSPASPASLPVLKDGRVVVNPDAPMPEPISAEKRLGRAGIGAYDGLAGVSARRDEKDERGGSGRGKKR